MTISASTNSGKICETIIGPIIVPKIENCDRFAPYFEKTEFLSSVDLFLKKSAIFAKNSKKKKISIWDSFISASNCVKTKSVSLRGLPLEISAILLKISRK